MTSTDLMNLSIPLTNTVSPINAKTGTLILIKMIYLIILQIYLMISKR